VNANADEFRLRKGKKMGQYHVLVNLDKKEIVNPDEIGLGVKQWEQFGDFAGSLADAMYLLCMTSPARGGGDLPRTAISGRWTGDRVVVLGDYTEDKDLPNEPDARNLYQKAAYWEDISFLVNEAFRAVYGKKLSEAR